MEAEVGEAEICKRCGCEFPDIRKYENTCDACETEEEQFNRIMGISVEPK